MPAACDHSYTAVLQGMRPPHPFSPAPAGHADGPQDGYLP